MGLWHLWGDSKDPDIVEQQNIRFALQKLKEAYRAVILLSYYHRLTHEMF